MDEDGVDQATVAFDRALQIPFRMLLVLSPS